MSQPWCPVSDLVKFLRARLDEDEAAAKAAVTGEIPQPWRFTERWQYEDAKRLYANRERALREVAFKRAILAEHDPEPWGEPHPELSRCGQGHGDEYWTSWPCEEIRALTAVWGDHPDYDQGWGGGAG